MIELCAATTMAGEGKSGLFSVIRLDMSFESGPLGFVRLPSVIVLPATSQIRLANGKIVHMHAMNAYRGNMSTSSHGTRGDYFRKSVIKS